MGQTHVERLKEKVLRVCAAPVCLYDLSMWSRDRDIDRTTTTEATRMNGLRTDIG